MTAAKRKGPTPPKPWEPLGFSHVVEATGARVFGNGRYTVTMHEIKSDTDPDGPTMTVLGIHTRTRSAVGAHDWRHFQRIKNELCGPEREGVELYPAESRLMDTANEFWLWVLPAGQTFGFGFTEPRNVSGPERRLPGEPQGKQTKWRQRRLDGGTR